jgi:beta-lactamase regulating signal transducer with metallopeptidase domain/nitrogen fixation protein FixH
MNLVYQSAFLKALGWSLLDSLWQMGALWVIYVVLTANGRKLHASQRHALALLSLAGGSLWFVITLVINFYQAAASPELVTLTLQPGEAAAALTTASQLSQWMDPVLPFLSLSYLVFTIFLFIRFYRQYRFTSNLSRQGLQKVNPELRVFLQQAAQHMSVPRKVSIWLSNLVDTPLTIGFWKPVILLPIAAISNLSMEQTEAIILHELYHIKRNDYLINLLVAFTDIILFFNPFARLLSAAIRREREHSCDDMVLQFRYDAGQYARALLVLEQNRSSYSPALAIPATGRNNTLLLNRVKRMLTNQPVAAPVSQKLAAWLVSALLIGFIGFYNPGRAIVTTIKEVAVAGNSSYTELPVELETPPAPPTPSPAHQAAPESIPAPEAMAIITDAVERETDDQNVTIEPTALISFADAQAREALQTIQQGGIAEKMIAFVGSKEMRDFSMQATQEALAAANSIGSHPYIPGNSFSIQMLEDTLLPKKYTMTVAEKQAKEALDKALLALQAVDWAKLEKEMKTSTGKQVDVRQLQNEIRKAIKEVDWKKINKEIEGSMQEAKQEIAEEQIALKAQMEAYGRKRQEKQEHVNQLQYQVLMDRLGENDKKQADCDADKKKTTEKQAKKLKIVII